MSLHSPEADFAALRAIAEQGRRAPLLGGRFLIAAGLWTSLGLVGTFTLGAHPEWGAPGATISALWITITILQMVTNAMLGRMMHRKLTFRTSADRAEMYAWSAMGIGMLVVVAAFFLAEAFGKTSPSGAWGTLPAFAFYGYGVAFAVSAGMSTQRWLFIPALGAFLTAGAIIFVLGTPTIMLLTVVGVFFLTVVPGLLMLAQEKRDGNPLAVSDAEGVAHG